MGLFDIFKKKEAPAAPAAPTAIDAQAGADVPCAPVSGKAIKLSLIHISTQSRHAMRGFLNSKAALAFEYAPRPRMTR